MSRIRCPEVSLSEMDNMCGCGRATDAPNSPDIAARLGADKAGKAFKPLLAQFGEKVKYVFSRLMDISMKVAHEQDGEGLPAGTAAGGEHCRSGFTLPSASSPTVLQYACQKRAAYYGRAWYPHVMHKRFVNFVGREHAMKVYLHYVHSDCGLWSCSRPHHIHG